MNALMMEQTETLKTRASTDTARHPASNTDSSLSLAYPTLLQLFQMERISEIRIRTHTGEHLKSPLAVSASNLASLLPGTPSTDDEHLVAYVAEDLYFAIEAFKRTTQFLPESFFSDVSHVMVKMIEKYHAGKDHVVREVMFTWLTPPGYWDKKKESSPPPDDLSPEEVKDLIRRWKLKEPGTFPE